MSFNEDNKFDVSFNVEEISMHSSFKSEHEELTNWPLKNNIEDESNISGNGTSLSFLNLYEDDSSNNTQNGTSLSFLNLYENDSSDNTRNGTSLSFLNLYENDSSNNTQNGTSLSFLNLYEDETGTVDDSGISNMNQTSPRISFNEQSYESTLTFDSMIIDTGLGSDIDFPYSDASAADQSNN